MYHILVCDDDTVICRVLEKFLTGLDYSVEVAHDGEECLARMSEIRPHAILLDIGLPGKDNGVEVLKKIRKKDAVVPVLVITGRGQVESAVDTMKLGALDYLQKPFDLKEIGHKIAHCIRSQALLGTEGYAQSNTENIATLSFKSPAMRRISKNIAFALKKDPFIFCISGEASSGKHFLANTIHRLTHKRKEPIFEIALGAISAESAEEELFGVQKEIGSPKRGRLELVPKGTLLLRDIDALPMQVQKKLAEAFAKRQLFRKNGTSPIKLESTIIATSRQDLKQLVQKNLFDQDLFFQINVFSFDMPALRERLLDMEQLAQEFLTELCAKYDKRVSGLSLDVLAHFQKYPWPGNLSELKNVLERMLVSKEGDGNFETRDLPVEIQIGAQNSNWFHEISKSFPLPMKGVNLEQLELCMILQALQRSNGKQVTAAKALGISRFALRNRLIKHQEKCAEIGQQEEFEIQ